MNYTGIIIALMVFFACGLGFVWVIKLEYHLGAHVGKYVAALGIATIVASMFVSEFWSAAAMGIVGGTIIWGATELPDQQKRAERGIFPIKESRRRQ